MKYTIKIILSIFFAVFLNNCAEFPESYENIIEDKKIRPMAIIVEPPEAAPGDTVHVTLVMHDAGKDYDVTWEVASNYTETNYGYLGNENDVSSIESADGKASFTYVIPSGENNPLLKSGLIADVVIPSKNVDDVIKTLFESEGVSIDKKGVTRENMVALLGEADELPAEFRTHVDEFVGLMLFTAKVRSNGFSLNVYKRYSVRYSNRIVEASGKSNVNANPVVNAIGIIEVDDKDIEDSEEIGDFDSDTVYFTRTGLNDTIDLESVVDTFRIDPEKSYFLIADTAGMKQTYYSPDGIKHREQLTYQWFYTNKDVPTTDWDELILLEGSDLGGTDMPVVRLRTPKNHNMYNFTIRLVVRDYRAEWGLRNSTGIGYLAVRGYFEYLDN